MCLENVERVLWKLFLIQISILIVIQALHQTDTISSLLNKSALYEGVTKMIHNVEISDK